MSFSLFPEVSLYGIIFCIRRAFALSHRFCIVVSPLSFVPKYILIASLIFSIIHWLFRSIFFTYQEFVGFSVFFLTVNFLSHRIVVFENSWNNFIFFLIHQSFFCGPRCGLSWRMCHVHLRRMYILLLFDGISYEHQVSLSGLRCHLRPVFPCRFSAGLIIHWCKSTTIMFCYQFLLVWLLEDSL